MGNENFNYEIFLVYYENAKKAQARGDISRAKENLLLAAQSLIKLAKEDSGSLKKARFERAQRLINMANSLDESSASIGETPKRNSDGRTVSKSAGAQKDDDSGVKVWKAAEIPDISFEDVAGLDDVKETIRVRMINPVKYPEKYAAYGKKSGGGVLLYGPPGTGKTMIAKAIAHEVGATFYAIKGSDIVSKWVGESEKNINSLFETARKDKLAIIFIDEMDSLFGQRGVDTHNDKRVNEFLQQIDGFVGKNPNLLILGATNRPWDVDGAAVRSGRFSEKIYVPLPDAKARLYLFNLSFKNVPIEENIDWNALVRFTERYSGADIFEICDRAKETPLKKYIQTDVLEKVTFEDILTAVKKVKPMVSKAEIERFEKYAGISSAAREAYESEILLDTASKPVDAKPPVVVPSNAANAKPENEPAPALPTDAEPEIIFAENEIHILPGQKPQIEFFLSKPYQRVFLEIDGKNYACTSRINNWTCCVDVDKPCTVNVKIQAKDLNAERTLTFVKGMQENQMDI